MNSAPRTKAPRGTSEPRETPTRVQVRAAMSIDPELLKVADALRARFNATMRWLDTPGLKVGCEYSPGEVAVRVIT